MPALPIADLLGHASRDIGSENWYIVPMSASKFGQFLNMAKKLSDLKDGWELLDPVRHY
jgi:hypothetical protein